MITDISDAGMIQWRSEMYLMIQAYCDSVKMQITVRSDIGVFLETGFLIFRDFKQNEPATR